MPNLSRWFNYAKARLDAAIGQGHRDLDELEAQREAELADRPWLRSSGDAPTFDEARARIQWEADQAARAAGAPGADAGRSSEVSPPAQPGATGGASPAPARPAGPAAVPAEPAAGGAPASVGPSSGLPITSPEERAAAAEAASARLEMEARQRESAARLDAIREELGIDPPDEGASER